MVLPSLHVFAAELNLIAQRQPVSVAEFEISKDF